MTRTLLLTEHQRVVWQQAYAQGERPSPMPYGVDCLEARGYQFIWPKTSSQPLVQKLVTVANHRTGAAWEHTIRGLATRPELVLALLERQGYAAAQLRSLGLGGYRNAPLVLWTCWLADDMTRMSSDERSSVVRRLRGADVIAHQSAGEHAILAEAGISPERLFPVTWGINHRFYQPRSQTRDIEVLAIGQDRGRDYQTLMSAVAGTDIALTVVCRPENLIGVEVPPNVQVLAPVGIGQYRQLLQRAQILAVPTHQRTYPTGSSVVLEGAASGCCVVVTDTPAMRELVQDGAQARLVPLGDPSGWREVLEELRADPAQRARLAVAARSHVDHVHNGDVMWNRLADHLESRGITQPVDTGQGES